MIRLLKMKLLGKRKKSILIVADIPNWAYHHIALFVKKNLSRKYNIYIDFTSRYEKKNLKGKILSLKILVKYSKIKFLHSYDIVVLLGFYFDMDFHLPFKYKYLVKGIYTSTFPPQGTGPDDWSLDKKTFLEKYFKNCSTIIAGSNDIEEFYSNNCIPVKYSNAPTIEENQFYKNNTKKISEDILTIGWTGNPDRGFKGYYDIIIPAIEKIKEKYGSNIRFKTRFKGPINTLPEFYNDIDLIVIASNGDAGPSMFWEASMCNVPCISTKNGWPGEVIIHKKNGILCERTIDEFYKWIDYLYQNRNLLQAYSNRIREDAINQLGEKVSIGRWEQAFDNLLPH